MSNEFVGRIDDNIVDIPDILEPKVGMDIRNPIEIWMEESLPASLYQYFTGNTKAKQAEAEYATDVYPRGSPTAAA